MAYKDEKLEAHRMFLEEKRSIEEIAKLMPNVSIKSLYRWAAEGNWQKEKEEISLTSFSAAKEMLVLAVEQMKQLTADLRKDGKLNPSTVYALRQVILSAKSLQKEVDSLGSILLAMEEWTSFLAERAPDLLKKCEPYLIEFGNLVSKKYRKG